MRPTLSLAGDVRGFPFLVGVASSLLLACGGATGTTSTHATTKKRTAKATRTDPPVRPNGVNFVGAPVVMASPSNPGYLYTVVVRTNKRLPYKQPRGNAQIWLENTSG